MTISAYCFNRHDVANQFLKETSIMHWQFQFSTVDLDIAKYDNRNRRTYPGTCSPVTQNTISNSISKVTCDIQKIYDFQSRYGLVYTIIGFRADQTTLLSFHSASSKRIPSGKEMHENLLDNEKYRPNPNADDPEHNCNTTKILTKNIP